MTTRRQSTATRRGDGSEQQRPVLPTAPQQVGIAFGFAPTLDGVKSLLNGVSARLPHQAPPPPPRKGTAWQEGYASAMVDARDLVAWIRDGLDVRDDIDAGQRPNAEG